MKANRLDDRLPEILRQVDLLDLVRHHAGPEARHTGDIYLFHCPAAEHADLSPSFRVRHGRWRCWSQCGAGGDAVDLVVWLTGLTKAQAIEELATPLGLGRKAMPRKAPAAPSSGSSGSRSAPTPALSPAPPPTKADRERLVSWCAGRGWGPWVVDSLGLSIVTDRYRRPRVRFPFRLDGRVAYHQDRAMVEGGHPTWLSPGGGVPIPYAADRIHLGHERGHIFVVEGVSDVAALVDAYVNPAVVGIPGVGCWRTDWAQAFTGLKVFVVGDNDPAGESFRKRLEADLQPVAECIWHIRVPEEFNDIAEWRLGKDPEAFDIEMMAAAKAAGTPRVEWAS